jgi:Coenzyme PQQ synthesis protein D (PqqD)
MTPEPQSFRRKAEVEMRRLTGAGVLVDAQGNHFGINPVGVRIWDLLDDAGSVDSLVETLLGEFDISDTRCREDTEAFLNELMARGLIEHADRR